MYFRSKGRSVLIGVITLVIAVSACLGLSVRQAAESAKESTMAELSITASISYDRSSMMNDMMGGYSNLDKTIIYFVVNRFQIARMRTIIKNIDPYAFVTISDVADVFKAND